MEKRKKRTRYARFGVFALLLSMLVPLPAFAAGSANVVRTFVYENNLYTYVELNEIERPVTQVEAKIGGQSFSASGWSIIPIRCRRFASSFWNSARGFQRPAGKIQDLSLPRSERSFRSWMRD